MKTTFNYHAHYSSSQCCGARGGKSRAPSKLCPLRLQPAARTQRWMAHRISTHVYLSAVTPAGSRSDGSREGRLCRGIANLSSLPSSPHRAISGCGRRSGSRGCTLRPNLRANPGFDDPGERRKARFRGRNGRRRGREPLAPKGAPRAMAHGRALLLWRYA